MAIIKYFKPSALGTEVREPSGIDDNPFEQRSEKDYAGTQDRELNNVDGDSIVSSQDGVKKAQATTVVWTRKSLIVVYAL
jgi:hypothetical protein